MLPFLEPKKITSIIIARRHKPDLEANPEMEAPGHEDVHPALKDAAADILSAMEHRSVIDLAKALQSAYDACAGGSDESEDENNEPMEDEE